MVSCRGDENATVWAHRLIMKRVGKEIHAADPKSVTSDYASNIDSVYQRHRPKRSPAHLHPPPARLPRRRRGPPEPVRRDRRDSRGGFRRRSCPTLLLQLKLRLAGVI